LPESENEEVKVTKVKIKQTQTCPSCGYEFEFHLSEAIRKKISASMTGKERSDEHKRNLSEAKRAYWERKRAEVS
jgi:hypothetical protein